MSKRRLGKRERRAGKRKIKMRSLIMGSCDKCTSSVRYKMGSRKAAKTPFLVKLVCGQCRKMNKTSTGAPIVGS